MTNRIFIVLITAIIILSLATTTAFVHAFTVVVPSFGRRQSVSSSSNSPSSLRLWFQANSNNKDPEEDTQNHLEDSSWSDPKFESERSCFQVKLQALALEFSKLATVEQVQKHLVYKGQRQQQEQQLQLQQQQHYQQETTAAAENPPFWKPFFHWNGNDKDGVIFVSPPTKVPGCMANVVIQIMLYRNDTVTSSKNNNNNHKNGTTITRLHMRGTCDAMVSRGLLATWIELIQDSLVFDLQELLDLNSYSLADDLQIRRALSTGRNDGLCSLVKTTQQLISDVLLLLQQQQQQPGEGDEKNSEPVQLRRGSNGVKERRDLRIRNADQETAASVAAAAPVAVATCSDSENRPCRRRCPTVALLLSGGVDSSVALHLLLQQGYDVTCFYLKIWLQDELSHLGTCPWEDDVQMCRKVCQHAGDNVPLEVISFQKEYQERVIAYTIHEAQQGRTPNPDIMCNSRIKFGCFYDALSNLQQKADDNAGDDNNYNNTFDFVATGHYAQVIRSDTATVDGGTVKLVRAPDPVKDQSYFLCALTQAQLQRVLFPIGHLQKSQVRQLALDWQLPNCHRPDSQGLCFLGKVKFGNFLKAYLGERPGNVVDVATGDVIGRHYGVWFHTVGQRRGIGHCLHAQATSRGPWYVVAKDPPNNIVYCSNQYKDEQEAGASLLEQPRSEFTVENISWIAGNAPEEATTTETENGGGRHWRYRFDMKIRHGPRLVQGTLQLLSSGDDDGGHESNEGWVRLDQKDGGLAPGQYVAFYRPDHSAECLGGGVISERHWARFLLQQQQQQRQQLNSEWATTITRM